MAQAPRFRIGELSRRVGVSPELLRAWEKRYGLLAPERTPGGLRLYSEDDERRVREMSRQMASGLSAAEAARVVLGAPDSSVPADQLLGRLDASLTALDEPSAQAVLDQTFASFDLETALAQVILPFLRNLGELWAATRRTVAQEHFASNVVGGRLRALARGWGDGDGPRVALACPAGEQHELGLISFGLVLRERGWRIAYFGAQTPGAELTTAISQLAPRLVVFSATGARQFLDAAHDIRALGALAQLAIGGPGASSALARSLGAELLPTDLFAAAGALGGAAS
jgi:MerR family transcriptional regulator, light-induced transcriptional regulator